MVLHVSNVITLMHAYDERRKKQIAENRPEKEGKNATKIGLVKGDKKKVFK